MTTAPAGRDVVVVAASAGGIEALQVVLGGVPADFGGVILVVVHLPEGAGSSLPAILTRAGPLPVTTAVDGEPLQAGHVYACRAGYHLLVGDGRVLVRRGPRENGHRPAADPLFRSAAYYFGPRVVGVVLSGTLSDGTAGLAAVRAQGGIAVVQDPDDARYRGMPSSALDEVGADLVLPAKEIGSTLAALALEPAPEAAPPDDHVLRQEVAIMETEPLDPTGHPGRPSPWPCPDCSGVLWEIEDHDVLRFRCRVGHAWSASSLLHAQRTEVETALWMAVRALEDRSSLTERLAVRADDAGRHMSARRFRADAEEVAHSIRILREVLHADGMLAEDHEGTDG